MGGEAETRVTTEAVVSKGKGIDKKYGPVSAAGKEFHPNEPVFVLRAQDCVGAHLIRVYAEMCELAGAPSEHVVEVLESAKAFEQWQARNQGKVKVPGT